MRDREIVLEVVARELHLRVGQELVISAPLEDSSAAMLRKVAHSYSTRRGVRFIDKTRN
jgi:hypothetical protein